MLFVWYNVFMTNQDRVTYFGVTDFRNKRTKFGIKNIDRSRHVYVIGKTGMGKSTLLENMAAQDILDGEGMCFVDPHGSAIDTLLEYVPEHRINDVVYFAPFDTNYPITFNVMEDVGADVRHLVVSGLMSSFKKIWQDAWSARMEYILTNTLLALLEYPGSTLLGVNRMLAEKDYRNEVVKNVTDASVKAFWIDEYGKWDPRYAREAGAAIQNKIGQFTANPLIRNIVGQSRSSFDIRKIMDEKKILLVNLSKGRIGEQNAKLLGGMLITKIYLAAMSRAEVGVTELKKLPDFYFFVDEFQNFATESFADILSEARKYKLNLTIAHQYVAQMQEEVKDAVVGNVGTMITFRIGAEDAELFEKQFSPVFTAEDIVNLGKFQIYLSLMIDGIGSKPFSAQTIAPIEKPPVQMIREVIESSRRQYAQERSVVEAKIEKWYEPIKKPERRKIDGTNTGTFKKNSKTTASSQTKNTFVVEKQSKERDVSGPYKKVLKEIDEKEAELEMKKIVSPKLNTLLEKFDKKNTNKNSSSKNKKIPEVIKNIKKNDSYATGKKNDRGADTQTKSSLQDALAKALGGKDKSDSKKTTNIKPRNDVSIERKVPAKEQGSKKPQQKIAQKKEPNKDPFDHSDYTLKKPEQYTGKKEVPEDILRDILG